MIINKDLIQYKLLQYKSITKIADEIGINRSTLSLFIKKEQLIKPKKINENFFETINNEENAYWLGFIMADGCIVDSFKSLKLSITLKLSDYSHLEKFHKSIESKFLVRKYKNRCVSDHTSNKLCNDLIKLGCVPRKSLILEYPNIQKILHMHFIRGYLDGDGCIYFNKKTNNWKIEIAGTKNILDSFQFILNTNIKLQKRGNIFILCIHGNNQVKRILDLLYTNSSIYLDRKYNKYKECYYS